MGGDEVVGSALDGLTTAKQSLFSDSSVLILVVLILAYLLFKWFSANTKTRIEVSDELEKQQREFSEHLSELGYNEDGTKITKETDQEGETANIGWTPSRRRTYHKED